MENITTLQQGVEEAKSLLLKETKLEGIVQDNLAKLLAESFEIAHRTLTILENKTT